MKCDTTTHFINPIVEINFSSVMRILALYAGFDFSITILIFIYISFLLNHSNFSPKEKIRKDKTMTATATLIIRQGSNGGSSS